MATRATTLISLARAHDWLDIPDATTGHDDRMAWIADAASELIELKTGVLFVTRTLTEVRDGDGTIRLALEQYPVKTLSTVTIKDTQDGSAKTIDAADRDVNLDTGIIRLRPTAAVTVFTKLFQNVTVGYDAGYGAQDSTDLPGDIVLACLDIFKLVWDEYKSGAIAASSINLGPGSLVIKPEWPMHIRDTLRQWSAAHPVIA